jgi:hypothetical protein
MDTPIKNVGPALNRSSGGLHMGSSTLEGKLLRRPGHLTIPHNSYSDQAIPPIKYAPLMMPKSATHGYLVDEDKLNALSCYIIGHCVRIYQQDRHTFSFSYIMRHSYKEAKWMPPMKEAPMLVAKEPLKRGK